MRRPALALTFLLGLTGIIAAGVGGLALWKRTKSQEIDRLLAEARAEVGAGNTDEAMKLFGRYLGQRRDDSQVRREYADLLLQKIRAGQVSRKEDVGAFQLLEEVVRESPEDHWLRYQLAHFQVGIRQYTSAFEHLKLLRQACGPDGRLDRQGPPRSPPDD